MQENSATVSSRTKNDRIPTRARNGSPLYFRLFFAFCCRNQSETRKIRTSRKSFKTKDRPPNQSETFRHSANPNFEPLFSPKPIPRTSRRDPSQPPPARIRLTTKRGVAILNHMVNYLAATLDSTFAALSDATRRGILAQLAHGETSVSELAAPYDISLPAVSKHLRVLEGAGLVARHKDGRVHRCRLVAEPMKGAAEWIEPYKKFWEQQFDALARYLEESGKTEISKWTAKVPAKAPAPKRVSKSGGRSRRPGKKSTGHGPNSRN
jgi:DNA-binding transcriptional ArsR family regulator